MKNKNEGKAKTIIIVVLLIVSFCSVGYIIYDKVFAVQDTVKIECNSDNDSINDIVSTITEDGFSVSNKTEIQNLHGYDYQVLISKEGNAYLTLSINGERSDNVKKNISSLQSKYTLNEIKGYCRIDGELAKDVCPNGDSVNSIKLDLENVIAAYDATGGQEIYGCYIIFLMEDGTISRINKGKLFEEGLIEIEKNVYNLTNVVTIVQSSSTGLASGYSEILAIEKNGTQHTLINRDRINN